jgi:hypothetical protein
MEEDAQPIDSPLLKNDEIQQQFKRLEKVVDEAQRRIDFRTAHDEDILKAIAVVERFLRKKRRVCYGGQAINSLLPAKDKFYDPEYTIPDYDFFSPTVHTDVDELVDMLESEGFEDVNKKVGMHEGTMKVFVNYVAVADCSEMDPTLFKIIQRRAVKKDGILFCDPDFLRMMMYLELSRPRGDVGRWKKVFERLLLLNNTYPPDQCDHEIKYKKGIQKEERELILEYCLQHRFPLCGPEIIYQMEIGKGFLKKEKLFEIQSPVICFSKQAENDIQSIKDILQSQTDETYTIKSYTALTDQLFSYSTLKRGSVPIMCIFQEEACHGYTELHVSSGTYFRVSTPDTLLHLYYSLMIFGIKDKSFFATSLQCLVEKVYEISVKAKKHPSSFLTGFSLRCSGEQKGMATLLRERVERTKQEKEKQKATRKKVKKSASRTRRQVDL